MNHHWPIKSSTLDLVKTLLVAIPAFLIFISYLYLSAYYYFFDINIFNYITINTIISYSIKSIGIVVLISIAGYIILIGYDFLLKGIVNFFRWFLNKLSDTLPKTVLILIVIISALILMPAIVYSIFYLVIDQIIQNLEYRILLKSALAFLFFIAIIPTVYKLRNTKSGYSLYNYRLVTTSIVLLITLLTVLKATLDAGNVMSSTNYKYVMGSELKGDYPNKKLKFIGKADNHYFFKFPDEKTIILKKFDDFKRFHLRTFNKSTKSTTNSN